MSEKPSVTSARSPDPKIAAPRLSLRWRLMLLVVVAIVPLLIFGLGYQYVEYRDDVRATGDHLLAVARGMVQVVEAELQSRITSLETLSTSSALEADDLDRFHARAAIVANQFPGSNILLLRENGQQLVNTILPVGAPLPVRKNLDSLKEVFATGRPVVSDVYPGAVGSRLVVAIDVPVKAADGTVRYVLSMNPSFDVFAEVIRGQHLPGTWIASVIDGRGVNIARFPRPEEFVGRQAAPSFLSALSSQHEGVLQSTSLEGIQLVSAFSHGTKFRWAAGVGVPQEELVQPIYSRAKDMLEVGGGLACDRVGTGGLRRATHCRPHRLASPSCRDRRRRTS
jgi:hypothetical protein